MTRCKISVLLCTVRGDQGYVNHPEWHTLQKVVDDLEKQTFRDFELVIVDGLREVREWVPVATFPIKWVAPTPSFWTRHKKVAIARYRNTGIAHCDGELIVNLDDCCELPPHYLALFAHAYLQHNVCLAACWPESGDSRRRGRVQALEQPLHPSVPGTEMRPYPAIYGFGSYPRAVALELNGYNEWFDGTQGLEDYDWSTRLVQAGVQMAIEEFKGFLIHAQSGHDGRCIDLAEPIVKCCNPAWWASRVWQQVLFANRVGRDMTESLIGPCRLLAEGNKCAHHMCSVECGYLDRGFAKERHRLALTGVFTERGCLDIAKLKRP